MDLSTLKQISSASEVTSDHLRALWFDLNGDWNAAHKIVQVLNDVNAMWIHAYLHRKEPDLSNARYWYRSAGKPFPDGLSFEEEAGIILANLV
jgi:hypothetical protein